MSTTGRDPTHTRIKMPRARSSTASAQQLGGGEPAAAGVPRDWDITAAAPGVQPRIAPAESDGQQSVSGRSCIIVRGRAGRPRVRQQAVQRGGFQQLKPRAGLLWLPSPVFSSAGESATPGAAAAASPDKVCASLAVKRMSRHAANGGQCGSGTYHSLQSPMHISLLCVLRMTTHGPATYGGLLSQDAWIESDEPGRRARSRPRRSARWPTARAAAVGCTGPPRPRRPPCPATAALPWTTRQVCF